jgi:hypothetical protein
MQQVVQLQLPYQNPALGIALKDWRTVYQLFPEPHPLTPEVYRGRLCYRVKGSAKRIPYDHIKKGLVKRSFTLTVDVHTCPF